MKVVALAGGVGGAKLADGITRNLPPENFSIVVNTGDDFEHLGLKICPDLDTVCYTLAGLANNETGWGRANESWTILENVILLGGPDWFRLGDKDISTHLERTRRLAKGETLTCIVKDFCIAWKIDVSVLPMSDQTVSTIVKTNHEGDLAFQDYFVRRRCEPEVSGFKFDGVDNAKPAPGVVEAITDSDVVIICPSNPWVSIGPILAIPGILPALKSKPVVAVSPIIGGQAVKGPAAKMFEELGFESSASSVAMHYGDLLQGFVIDFVDCELEKDVRNLNIKTMVTNTLMKTIDDRKRLAKEVLTFCEKILVDF